MNDRMLELAQWRRRTAEMYSRVREISEANPVLPWEEYRKRRDQMFRSDPQSPLDPDARALFNGLEYFPYDPAWRFVVPITPIEDAGGSGITEIGLPEGPLRCRKFASVPVPSLPGAVLALYWLEGYGGGLFLPFKDLTNGAGTYGGGRYLYDTIKGADLGAGPDVITLPKRVEAGERAF